MRYERQEGPEVIIHEVFFDTEEVQHLFKNEIFRALEHKVLQLLPESQPSGGVVVAHLSPTEQDFPKELSLRWHESVKTDGRTVPSTPPPMMFPEKEYER